MVVKKMIREKILHRLLSGKPKTLPSIVVALSMLTVKKSGMGLKNPVTSAEEKFTSSLCTSDKLIGAVKGNQVFSNDDCIQVVKGGRRKKKGYPE